MTSLVSDLPVYIWFCVSHLCSQRKGDNRVKETIAPVFPLSEEDGYLLFCHAACTGIHTLHHHVLSVLLFGVVFLKVPGASPSVAHHWAARSDCSKCWDRRRWVTVAFGGGGSCRRNTSCLQMWPAAGAGGSQTATTRESLEIRVKTVALALAKSLRRNNISLRESPSTAWRPPPPPPRGQDMVGMWKD